MIKNHISFFLLLFCGSFNLFAQELNVVHYSTSDGLSNSCIYGLHQDKKGFLWIATEFGLNRFDGHTFKTYDASNGFPENIILSSSDGPGDDILVGTFSKGIIKINSSGNIQKIIDPFNRGQIFKLYYSDSLMYAYSRYNVCIYNFRTNAYKFFDANDNGDTLIDATEQFEDKTLLGNKNGLFLFSNTQKYQIKSNIPLKNISAIHYDINKNIWIGTKGVVYKLNSKNFAVTDSVVFDNRRENRLDCILVDYKDDLWFSTILPICLNKVTKKSGYKNIENISEKLNLGATDINNLLLDREKNIWIATYNKGFYCIRNTFLYTDNLFKDVYINSIFVDSRSNIYLGSIDGINISNPKSNSWIKIHAKQNSREYTYGYVEHNRSLYFLTNGTYPEHYTLQKNGQNIIKVAARTMLFINDSIAIFGGWQNHVEIKKLKNNKFEYVNSILLEKTDATYNRVNDIVSDKKGIIWCASDLGVFVLDIINNRSISINDKRTKTKINDIVVDKNNTVWFATENSILKYKNSKWDQYFELNDQKIGMVNSLTLDKKNRLYVGTLKGLFIIENETSNYLDDKSGLVSNEINELVYDNVNNNILIATNDSYSYLNINQYENFKKLPLSINLTSVLVNDSVLPIRKDYTLNYEKNNIQLNFVAINLTFPRSVRYQYNIDNGQWLNVKINTLELASLKHGFHKVKIRASLDNINWCEPKEINITVTTPFYYTVRFWLIIVLSLFLFSFFLIQYRFRRIRIKASEKMVLQQQLEDLKFKALNASINPHFIFNSLNSIQNYINHNDKNKASNFLAKFARLIRLVLDKANEKEITIKEEIERLSYYIQLEQDRFDQSFTFAINASVELYELIIPNMIIQPLVENAILHGIKGVKDAHINICFTKEDNTLIIRIDDNGVGIEQKSNNPHQILTHKSMAINNIRERLSLYPNTSLVIVNKKNMVPPEQGTLAKITLSI